MVRRREAKKFGRENEFSTVIHSKDGRNGELVKNEKFLISIYECVLDYVS